MTVLPTKFSINYQAAISDRRRDLRWEGGSFIPLLTVQGEGRVPDICSSERLLGRGLSVFQDPRW